jgi:hypothetical protein
MIMDERNANGQTQPSPKPQREIHEHYSFESASLPAGSLRKVVVLASRLAGTTALLA